MNVTPAAGRAAFDGAAITKVPDRGYIHESGRLALSGTSCCKRVYMGLEGATAIGDDADATRESDGAAVEEKEPR